MSRFDIAINSGFLFDGTGRPGRLQSVGIRDGRVAEIRETSISAEEAAECIDASGAGEASPLVRAPSVGYRLVG